jgi:tRNA A-37 threonylcarbamoyl transferase component Bud32
MEPFNLKEEIKKLEESKRRDFNIIAFYIEKKKPDIRTKGQFVILLKRCLKSAKDLKEFDNDQITKSYRRVVKEYPEIWTIETLLKTIIK